MNKLIFGFVVCVLMMLIQAQTPPSWGGNPRYTVRVNILNNAPAVRWNFTYYYDWNQKV